MSCLHPDVLSPVRCPVSIHITFLQSYDLSPVRRHACVQLACFNLDVLSAFSCLVCIQLSCLHSVVSSAFSCPVCIQLSRPHSDVLFPSRHLIFRFLFLFPDWRLSEGKLRWLCPREAITNSRGAKSTPCTGMSLFTCTIITGFSPFPTYKRGFSSFPTYKQRRTELCLHSKGDKLAGDYLHGALDTAAGFTSFSHLSL